MTSPPTTRIARPGPGERLAPDQAVGQAELGGYHADLVLEEGAQRLDQVEVEVLGQAADVVVDLIVAASPSAAAGLDHVRVERPWTRKRTSSILRASCSKTRMNSSPMISRLSRGRRPGEPVEEAVARVDVDQRDPESVAEGPTTCSASSLRIIPWSTKTQVRRSPIARWTATPRWPSRRRRRGRRSRGPRPPGRGSPRSAHRSPRPMTTPAHPRSRAGRLEHLACRAGCARPRGGTGSRRGRGRCPRRRRPVMRG